ncbi:MAG: hypothetical protein CSB44_11070 [Gammaproteobacteria bacterium]|nr:MAG: hypothetical protein CSB44_11070 [Gammaproteobacteria bacterium]
MPDSLDLDPRSRKALDGIFEPLFVYSDLPVFIHVYNHEHEEPYNDVIMGNRRTAVVAEYLISRGVSPERLYMSASQDRSLPMGTHKVSVGVEAPTQ